jgi:hypothetical protein
MKSSNISDTVLDSKQRGFLKPLCDALMASNTLGAHDGELSTYGHIKRAIWCYIERETGIDIKHVDLNLGGNATVVDDFQQAIFDAVEHQAREVFDRIDTNIVGHHVECALVRGNRHVVYQTKKLIEARRKNGFTNLSYAYDNGQLAVWGTVGGSDMSRSANVIGSACVVASPSCLEIAG